jgi:signal transduction histidine kinase
VTTSTLAGAARDAARRSRAWLRSPWPRRQWVVDASLIILFGAFAVFGTVESVQQGRDQRPLDWRGWGLLAVATLVLALRRRRPLLTIALTVAATAASVAGNYPTGPIWAAPLIALYSAAAIGRRALALVTTVGLIAGLVGWAFAARDPGSPGEIAATLLLVLLALAIGEVTRGRRDYLAEVERRAIEAERTREELALRLANEERLRLARDLHDITAHTIAVIAIQASVAEEALASCEACGDRVADPVRAIRAASREAMAELKATVTTLRDGAAPRESLPGLNRLDELVRMASGAGVRVGLETSGEVRQLPPAVDVTAFRIVQESLTNVLRHARATTATVRLRYGLEALGVEVDDDGSGPRPQAAGERGVRASSGHGLELMAERAAAVGGWLSAGPASPAGFSVRARLPLREGAA